MMKKYNTVAELIEAKAKASHEANLKDGGVFKDGERTSDLATEMKLAKKSLLYVGGNYAKFEGIYETVECVYIKNFGYAVA
jgi:hypothetical protein